MNQRKQYNRIAVAILAVIWLAGPVACGGLSSSTEGSDADNETSDVFPSSLAVSSPFDLVEDDSSANLTKGGRLATTPSVVTYYSWSTGEIDKILTGTSAADCRFDPELFMARETDASCFGPTVAYEGHPDYTGAPLPSPQEDGDLPIGDVGIWTETDPDDGNACAVAELNARMQGVGDKSLASLMGLASLICTANTNGIALPSNSTLDLTAEMTALGISDIAFTSATISHSSASGSNEWSYALDLEYTPGTDTHHIVVAMTHIPSGTPAEFQGRLSYRVNEGNSIAGNCPSTETTYNGSLLYQSGGIGDMDLEARGAYFCGYDSDGMAAGLVDPSNKYDSASNPTGWANTFSILTANFDPATLAGDFAYSWQAGQNDANTRVFDIHAEEDSSGFPSAKAFYGYGSDIDGTDGGIDGFVCDWTTPAGTQTVQDLTQYQEVSYDSGSGTFGSDDANIIYAVTHSCEYDGIGSFTYDSDLDGSVDTDPAVPVANDLLPVSDADGDGIFDEIEAAGFALPAAPPNI